MNRLMVCLILLIPLPCLAEYQAGISAPFYIDTDLRGGAAGGYGAHVEYQTGSWFGAVDHLRDITRTYGQLNHQTFLTVGHRWRFNRLQLQLGVALNNRTLVLGSGATFNLGVGYQAGPATISWLHWSNANLNKTNHGVDALVITWRFQNR